MKNWHPPVAHRCLPASSHQHRWPPPETTNRKVCNKKLPNSCWSFGLTRTWPLVRHGIQPLKREQGRREGAFGRERGLHSQSWISQSTAFKGTDVTASKTLNLSKHIHHAGKLCFPIWCDIRPRINQHALEKKKPKINTSKLFQPPAQYLLIVKIHLRADKW